VIAKLVKGRGFRGALEYDLQKQKGVLLDTNMAGDNPRDLAREFGEVRALRPNLAKAVCHASISLSPEEKLSDDQWRAVAREYLKGMGFGNSQHVVTKHLDTKHPHIHVLANRVTMRGEVVSDSKDYQRQEAIMRRMERAYGLKEVEPSKEALRRAPTKGEIECAVRTGEPSAKMTMQALVDKALHNTPDYEEFKKRLEKSGVEVIPNAASTGRISGISYRQNEITMKGSDLGKGYSWAGLQKRGLTYEQNRCATTNGRGGNGAVPERSGGIAGKDTRPQSAERGRIGAITRTLNERHAQNNLRRGSELGSANPEQQVYSTPTRRDNQDMELSHIKNRDTRGDDSELSISDGQRRSRDTRQYGGNGETGKDRQQTPDMGALGIPTGDGSAGVSALERIRAMANAGLRYVSPHPERDLRIGEEGGGEGSGSRADREEVIERRAKERKKEIEMER